MASRASLLPETHFHAETPSPPRLDYPSSRLSWRRAEALLKRETKAQESGKKVAAIHQLLPAVVQLTVQFIRTIRNGIVPRMRCLAAPAPLRISMTAYPGGYCGDFTTCLPTEVKRKAVGDCRSGLRGCALAA